jgi:hypothetical protein
MATKPTIRAIQTPGEPIQPGEPNEGQGLPKPDAFTARVVTTGADIPFDEMTEMAQMRAQMAAMMQQNASLQAAVNNLARGVQASRPVVAELPSLSDLDAATITSPVLTKEGWFVPETYGANPAIAKQ